MVPDDEVPPVEPETTSPEDGEKEEEVSDEAQAQTETDSLTPLKVFTWIAKFEEENPKPEMVEQEEERPLEVDTVTMSDTG